MKKIGRYLIESRTCDEATLNDALEKQFELKQDSVFKPLGLILTESGAIAEKDLNRALSRLHFDRMSASTLFREISCDSIQKTLSSARPEIIPEDQVVYHAGEVAESFYIVVAGRIKVYIEGAEESEKTLAILEPGDCFGEIAFFTGEPHRTSTRSIEPASLLEISKENFNKLCAENGDVSQALIKTFASRLVQKEAEIFKAGEKEKAYQKFVSQQDELSLPELIGQTNIINRLRQKIETAAENDKPVIIHGPAGTEKLVVAGNIHKNSIYSSAPFLSMDAENIALEGYGAILEADSGTLQLEMAQSGILFGYEDSSFSFSKARGLGLLQICRQGSVIIKNIEKLTLGVQEKLLEYLRTGTFFTVGGRRPISSSARIMGTTSADLEQLASEGKFDRELLKLLQSNTMAVPPISKRKSDLRLLVDFIIIMECFKTPDRKLIKGISPEAYQRIMEYDWPGNMDELQIVIRRAINLAHTDYLMPEDIFIGMAPPKGKYTINLLQFKNIRKFFGSKAYPVLFQLATVSVFSLIFLMAFGGSQSPENNVSLLLVWAMWEPILVISWFIGARLWCSVCPMGAANDLLNRFGSKKFKVPAFIQNHGVYIGALGLAVIIWSQAATDMHYSPMATGYLLLAITLFAVLSGLLFERRLWCRYLCPLGMLGAVFSGCSIVEWRANSSICNSTCKDNTCYKGDETRHGCPLYQGPFALRSNQNCILCGNCVKVCPNDSPALNLRIPGHELWASLKPEKVTTVIVPVILGTQVFRGLAHGVSLQNLLPGRLPGWLLYIVLLFVATAAAFLYTRVSGRMAFRSLRDAKILKGDLFIHAIIPLAFAFEIAYQIKPLFTRFGHILPMLGRQFGVDWQFLDFAYQPDSIIPWQVFFIIVGTAASMGFLRILIRKHQEPENGTILRKPFRHLPILLLAGLYMWIFTGL